MQVLKVLHPGANCAIQDAGRPNLRRYGIPVSGAMDQFSYRVANLLVGNPSDLPAIEVTLMGLVVEALAPLAFAITGADLVAHLNDQPAPLWTALTMQAGDRLNFKGRRAGCRAYLAVRGGIDGPQFLGARSTFLRGGMGAPLQPQQVLGALQPELAARWNVPRRWLAPALRPSFAGPHVIHVLMGPQDDRFTANGTQVFLHCPYHLSPKSDRQGLRLQGPPIETIRGSDIISDPTPLGAIQIPGDGQPIILHRDGQVTGGYAKIAIVASADLDTLGRLAPGDVMRFKAISVQEAQLLAENARRQLLVLDTALRWP